MNTGKLVRLNRLFAHSSRRLCSVAVDHFMIYQTGMPEGLRDIPAALRAIVKAKPDAITMQIGMAKKQPNAPKSQGPPRVSPATSITQAV